VHPFDEKLITILQPQVIPVNQSLKSLKDRT
jgi:hypothetical protein